MNEQMPDVDRLASQLQQADRRIEELRQRYYVMLCLITVLTLWTGYLLIDRHQQVTRVRQWSAELALLPDKISDVSSNVDDLQGEFDDLDNNTAEWKELSPEVNKISGDIRREVTDLDERIEKLGDRISNAASENESDE